MTFTNLNFLQRVRSGPSTQLVARQASNLYFICSGSQCCLLTYMYRLLLTYSTRDCKALSSILLSGSLVHLDIGLLTCAVNPYLRIITSGHFLTVFHSSPVSQARNTRTCARYYLL